MLYLGIADIRVGAIVGVVLLAPYAVRAQTAWIDTIQRRLVVTVDLINGAKGVKMSGLVDRLYTILTALRLEEISASKRYRSIVTGIFTFCMSPLALCVEYLLTKVYLASIHSILTPTVSFSVYAFVSRSKHGAIGTLDSPRAFTCLALLELMGEALMSLLQAISNMASAVGCINHIQELLNQSQHVDGRTHKAEALLLHARAASQQMQPCLVATNVSAGWEGPVIRNISFDIPFECLTMFVGPVGCGKSTLLKAIIGETPYNVGEMHIYSPSIAYCSQTPWLVNGTIRDNVLGASPYQADWYRMVIRACGLEVDISSLTKGHDTMVGTQGASLSGGQKQRVVSDLRNDAQVRQEAD